MKVIIKCAGVRFMPEKIQKFFFDNIFPAVISEIAIENSRAAIVVFKNTNGKTRGDIDHTVEIIVELTETAREMALNANIPEKLLKEFSGKFFDEAIAIRKIEELNPWFSREYYSCNYREGKEISEGQ